MTEMTRPQLEEKLLSAYARWYDLERAAEGESPLFATGQFHERMEGFFLTKAAKSWGANRHEYVFFYSVPRLDEQVLEALMQDTLTRGEPLVQPGKEHMSTYLVTEILCDQADADAVKAVKKYRRRKNFHFSLWGWMEHHLALVELGKGSIVSNPDGCKTAEFLKKAIDPPGKKTGLLPKLR